MRHLALATLLLTLAACGADAPADTTAGGPEEAPATKPAKAEQPAAPPTVTATWRGDGETLAFSAWKMGCSGCEHTIQKRLGEIEGVTAVKADMANSEVTVTLAEGTPRETVIEKITHALEAPDSGKRFEIVRAAAD